MLDGNVPSPPRERGRWALALALLLAGAGVLAAVLSGGVGSEGPPPLPAATATPAPAATVLEAATGRRRYVSDVQPTKRPQIVARPPTRAAAAAADPLQVPVAQSWMQGFYPIYEVAQRSFHVNWLLIASIHRQETAFSTAASTYDGLNYAGCCGGPMQFNVKNGPRSTWSLVKDSYRDGPRPRYYDHRTASHPSIYDDFDSIMAAAHLLELDGASMRLDDAAWWAAYDYYGHDYFGVQYADEVIARAIGWSQHGFCASCGTGARLVAAVSAAYGAPVRAALAAEQLVASGHSAHAKRRHAGASRHGATRRRASGADARSRARRRAARAAARRSG